MADGGAARKTQDADANETEAHEAGIGDAAAPRLRAVAVLACLIVCTLFWIGVVRAALGR